MCELFRSYRKVLHLPCLSPRVVSEVPIPTGTQEGSRRSALHEEENNGIPMLSMQFAFLTLRRVSIYSLPFQKPPKLGFQD